MILDGLWTGTDQTPGYPSPHFKGKRVVFTTPRASNGHEAGDTLIRKTLLLVIAHQKGMTADALQSELQANGGVIHDVLLPANAGNVQGKRGVYSGLITPLLKAVPYDIDTTKPYVFSWGCKDPPPLGNGLTSETLIQLGTTGIGEGYYADNGQLHYLFDNETAQFDFIIDSLAEFMEFIARLYPGFTDDPVYPLAARVADLMWRNYKPGNTVVPREKFYMTDPAFTRVTYQCLGYGYGTERSARSSSLRA